MLLKLVQNGMNIARLNLSHCDHEFAALVIKNLREVQQDYEIRSDVAIWLDMNGPKVRYRNLIERVD